MINEHLSSTQTHHLTDVNPELITEVSTGTATTVAARLGRQESWFYKRVPQWRWQRWVGLCLLILLNLACSAGGLVQRAVDTPAPTRALAPTYTSTPDDEQVLPQIIITPPRTGTPGVIIIPDGMDPSLLIPTLFPTPIPSATPLPIATTPSVDGATPPSVPTETGGPPEQQETPGIVSTPLPTDTPIPTDTPLPTSTFTPVPTSTPFAVVGSGLVSLRTGPGVEYPLVAQLGPRIPIAITGQNPEGTWYRLCCVNRDDNTGNDGSVWVVSNNVETVNDATGVELIANVGPPPPPTPTATFTPTPTITPTPTATLLPFDRYTGPQFFPTSNEFLTIWVKLFVGPPPNEDPAGGYYLKVFFEGVERESTNGTVPSAEEFSAVSVPGTGYSNLTYNLKYEYRPPDPKSLPPDDPNFNRQRVDLIGTGTWEFYVVDGAGNRLTDIIEFETSPSNPNREVYVAWQRVR